MAAGLGALGNDDVDASGERLCLVDGRSCAPHARTGSPDAVEQSVLRHAEVKTHNVWSDGLDSRAGVCVERRAAVRRRRLVIKMVRQTMALWVLSCSAPTRTVRFCLEAQ